MFAGLRAWLTVLTCLSLLLPPSLILACSVICDMIATLVMYIHYINNTVSCSGSKVFYYYTKYLYCCCKLQIKMYLIIIVRYIV